MWETSGSVLTALPAPPQHGGVPGDDIECVVSAAALGVGGAIGRLDSGPHRPATRPRSSVATSPPQDAPTRRRGQDPTAESVRSRRSPAPETKRPPDGAGGRTAG